jgi:lipoprotein NlpD
MTLRLYPTRLHSSTATIVVAVALAGCAGRSLNTPQIVEWSNGAQPTVSPAQSADSASVTYTVRRDDTLASIATRFNATPTNIAAWNNLGPNPRVQPGQIIRVSPPGSPTLVDTSPIATTQPIGIAGVEQRSIGAPNEPSTNVPIAPSTGAAVPSNAPIKSGPLGVKRPYSDAALAELARPDGDNATPAATVPSPAPAPTTSIPAPGPASSVMWSWPTSGKPSGAFDEKTKGIDIVGRAGDPVLSAADGKVTFAGTGVRGYGNFVIVQHSPEFLSVYAHNRTNLVKEGAVVTKGQKIAEMGNTDTDGVRLHFEIRRDSKPVDPMQYLPPR